MAMSHFEGASGNCARSRFINIVFLSAASIAVKLSLLVYGLSICSVALLVLMADQASPREVWRPIGIALVLTSVVLVPWCVRGVILTGCPAYPATVMRFDLEWSVSEASAKTMVMHIKAWARAPWDAPETVLAGWGWFRPWLERTLATNVFDVRFPLMTVLLAKAIFWLQISRKECIELRHCVLLCMPAVLALGFWFWSAPDPRFLGSISWVLAATLLVLALQHKRAWSLPLILSHSVMVLAGCVNPIDVVRAYKDTSVAQQVPMATRVTRSGLSVYVPVDGDQSWDAELPSTPYFTARLALRDSSDLSKGFVKGPLMRKEGE